MYADPSLTWNSLRIGQQIEIQWKPALKLEPGEACSFSWWFARITEIQEFPSTESALITLVFEQYSQQSRYYLCSLTYRFDGTAILTDVGVFGGILIIPDGKIQVWLNLLKSR